MASNYDGRRKRRRNESTFRDEASFHKLMDELENQEWEKVQERIARGPSLFDQSSKPSPLFVACRLGAPLSCVESIIRQCPNAVRILDSRGTPLHEAVVCERIGADAIALLLKIDEDLGPGTRATLLQDVDGYTPLHLLIRRRFQSHIMLPDQGPSLLRVLEMLVKSCPEAVVIPDKGEYEEPPIVYAVKADIYAPGLASDEAILSRVEKQIHNMVECMLRYNPRAASRVFKGYRGQYTALHSAVFHGRNTRTIQLLLSAEAHTNTNHSAPLLQNTQGEIPLHFCAMRGERARSVALIANAAGEGVTQRDTSGLSPFHWLWIRFLSTQLSLEDDGRGVNSTMLMNMSRRMSKDVSPYSQFSCIEEGDFDADLHLIKRMDPPVDFLRMRHIPTEATKREHVDRIASRSAKILSDIRRRFFELINPDSNVTVSMRWSREEIVSALFWTKVVALLQAANVASETQILGGSVLVHTAFATKCCPPPVASLVTTLFPGELELPDEEGRLPIHHASMRQFSQWDYPATNENLDNAAKVLQNDTEAIVRSALDVTSDKSLGTKDSHGRLPLHYLVTSVVRYVCTSTAVSEAHCQRLIHLVLKMASRHPTNFHAVDGISGLVAFVLAAATAGEVARTQHRFSTSLSFELLRAHPTTLDAVRQRRASP